MAVDDRDKDGACRENFKAIAVDVAHLIEDKEALETFRRHLGHFRAECDEYQEAQKRFWEDRYRRYACATQDPQNCGFVNGITLTRLKDNWLYYSDWPPRGFTPAQDCLGFAHGDIAYIVPMEEAINRENRRRRERYFEQLSEKVNRDNEVILSDMNQKAESPEPELSSHVPEAAHANASDIRALHKAGKVKILRYEGNELVVLPPPDNRKGAWLRPDTLTVAEDPRTRLMPRVEFGRDILADGWANEDSDALVARDCVLLAVIHDVILSHSGSITINNGVLPQKEMEHLWALYLVEFWQNNREGLELAIRRVKDSVGKTKESDQATEKNTVGDKNSGLLTRLGNWLWKLYDKTIKAFFDAFFDHLRGT